MQHHLVFCRHEILFCAISTLFWWHEYFFVQHKHVFVETKSPFVQRQTFYFNKKLFFVQTKFLFQTSFRMLCHGHIFLLSHSNKNIITSQKINKLSFLCDTKKINFVFLCITIFLYSVFTLHFVSMLIFFVVVLETKKLLTIFYSPVWYIQTKLLSKSFSRKMASYYLGFMFVKRLRRAHILVKLQACFTQILQKLMP